MRHSTRRRLLLSGPPLAVAAGAGTAGPAGAAPPTNAWRLGGNGEVVDDGTNWLGTRNRAPLIVKTSPGRGGPRERMRVTPDGLVGIGSTRPDHQLDVRSLTTVAVHAVTRSQDPQVSGLWASCPRGSGVLAESPEGYGVEARGGTYGVYARGGYGVVAVGVSNGVYAESTGDAAAVFASGDLTCTGTITSGDGARRIDHPLDPDRRWLTHGFVESPEMTSVYHGNVSTDADGRATVELPSYVHALNRDFRYQLTVIGAFAQAIVSRTISDGSFEIRTDHPHVRVSWQVTGIRHDDYARAHPVVVEQPKSAVDQGTRQYVPPGSGARPMRRPLDRREA